MATADQVQIELLRKRTPQQRFQLARALTIQAMASAHRAIERAFPELGPWQRKVKFVEIHYGRELAAGFARHLAARGLLEAT